VKSAPLAVGDLALLGDCQTAAIVGRFGGVEWLCPPDFDSPSVFGRLLDPDGGHLSIAPVQPASVVRRYRPGTLVLETTFTTADGVVRVTDGLLLGHGERGHEIGRASPHVLVRVVEGVRGAVRMHLEHRPKPDYARADVALESLSSNEVRGGGVTLVCEAALTLNDASASASWVSTPGTPVTSTLMFGDVTVADPRAHLDDTIAAWRSWVGLHHGYRGHHQDLVQHSAIVLQALTHAPTGAIIAAPTTSLVEAEAPDATWDYRYGWLRDTSMTVQALWVAACPDEAQRYFSWIARVTKDSPRIQVVYGIHGETDLTEHTLDNLSGFNGARPVRVGNGAWDQEQLDVPGEVLDAAWQLRDQLDLDDPTIALLCRLADHAADHWADQDSGMWEGREGTRDYVSSKVLCWVALDRAVRMSDRLGDNARPQIWQQAADAVRAAVLEKAWSSDLGAYTGAFGSDHLDASVLLMPIVGFLPADDPRMLATINVIAKDLNDNGLMVRWTGAEGAAFAICSYWLADCLARAGQLDRAVEVFNRVTQCANDVGLLSEEIDPQTNALMGNFPQGLSHVGLVNAAWSIEQLRRSKDTTMGKLTDRTAIVTGSDSGIGQACAIEFAKEGADVVVTYLEDADGAKKTAAAVEDAGRRAVIVHLDVTKHDDVVRLFTEAREAFGTIDILVNSAGVDAGGVKVADMDLAKFDTALKTNLYGPVMCAQQFIRQHTGMNGRIINITSVHEEIPRAGGADYDCSKGALRNLTRTLSLELAEEGITVNNIAPGMVLTPFNQKAIDDPKVLKEQTASIPMKRAAQPSEIGRLAVFLASDDAAYVTGSSYVIDGGLMQNQGQGA